MTLENDQTARGWEAAAKKLSRWCQRQMRKLTDIV